MKKKFFFMAAAAIALASCSSEDVVEVNNGNAIDFRVTMGAETNSRGVETKNGNLDRFYVTAVNNSKLYFHNELFSKAEGATKFTSTNTYFWPGDKSTVDFYAYGYAGNLKSLDADLDNATINATSQKINFTPATAPADQLDLVVATGNGSSATTGAVDLKFDHALSQIQILAKNTNDNYVYEVEGIKIAKVKSVGEYDFGTKNWTASGDITSYEVPLATPITLNATAQPIDGVTDAINGAMLIPQAIEAWDLTNDKTNSSNGFYLAVKVKITMKGTKTVIFPTKENVTYAYACKPIKVEWTAGNNYIYTLDFSNGAGVDEEGNPILGGPIEFTADVKGWTDVNEKEIPM